MVGADALERVEVIRQRTGLSYGEARGLLNEAGGDVLEALVLHESRQKPAVGLMQLKGSEVLDRMKQMIRNGNLTHLLVRRGERVILDLPVTASVVGAVLAPTLAGIGVLAALFTQCTIEFENRQGERKQLDRKSGQLHDTYTPAFEGEGSGG